MKGMKIALIAILSMLVIGMSGMLIRMIARGGGGWGGFYIPGGRGSMSLHESEELSPEGIRRLQIRLGALCYDVRVLQGDGDKLVIEKWYTPGVSEEQQVRTRTDGDTLVLEAEEKQRGFRWFWGINPGAGRVCIYLPKEGLKELEEADIYTSAGDVEIKQLEVRCRVETVSGDMAVGEIKGEIRIETVSGDVSVRSWTGYGAVEGISGDVEIGFLAPEGDLSIQTVSGDIEISVAEGSEVEIETDSVSGDEDVEAPQTRGGHSLQLETISGDIAVR